MADQFKTETTGEMVDIIPAARIKVIQTEDMVIIIKAEQFLTEMRAQKAGAAGDEYSLCHINLLALDWFIMVINFGLWY